MVATPRSSLPVLLAGDDEADLDRVALALGAFPARLVPARGLGLACAALRGAEYAAAIADVATLEEALAILRAAGRTRPVTPVLCLFPAYLELPPGGPTDVVTRMSFKVRHHPLPPAELRALLEAAISAPRLLGARPDEASDIREERGVA